MFPYLNFHAHREAVSPRETVIRNVLLPLSAEEEDAAVNAGKPFSAGIHPWHLPASSDDALRQLGRMALCSQCVAIGEAGLDKCCTVSFSLQCDAFARQLGLAGERGLPVIIHCVKAWEELLAIMKRIRPGTACVIHGFRGKPQLAENLLTRGFYLSFGLRFNSESLRLCPPERLFLETDEARCSVEALYHTAADLRGCSPESLNMQCLQNLYDISQNAKK